MTRNPNKHAAENHNPNYHPKNPDLHRAWEIIASYNRDHNEHVFDGDKCCRHDAHDGVFIPGSIIAEVESILSNESLRQSAEESAGIVPTSQVMPMPMAMTPMMMAGQHGQIPNTTPIQGMPQMPQMPQMPEVGVRDNVGPRGDMAKIVEGFAQEKARPAPRHVCCYYGIVRPDGSVIANTIRESEEDTWTAYAQEKTGLSLAGRPGHRQDTIEAAIEEGYTASAVEITQKD